MMSLSKTNQRGDTIVEVLIALTVVGTMLTGAYASARRSLFAVMASQERLEALKLAEGQVERIKYKVNSEPVSTNPTTYTGAFCIDSSNSRQSDSNPSCKIGPDSRYNISATRTAVSTEHTFTVNVSWDRIGGGGDDALSLSYKVNN